MSNKIRFPSIAYTVTTLQNTTVSLTASAFYEQLRDIVFVNNIQGFDIDMWHSARTRTEGALPDISQQKCLIAQEFVPTSDFNTLGFHALYNTLQERVSIPQGMHYMLTYDGTLEPVPEDAVIYNRNMDLLYPQTPHKKAVQEQLKSAETASALSELPAFRLN